MRTPRILRTWGRCRAPGRDRRERAPDVERGAKASPRSARRAALSMTLRSRRLDHSRCVRTCTARTRRLAGQELLTRSAWCPSMWTRTSARHA